ncbi:MAG: hypothetical protein EXR62_16155 [Chloroflexi bacterium]|nr:hypothetical protein [Chloroflexota bacterium]
MKAAIGTFPFGSQSGGTNLSVEVRSTTPHWNFKFEANSGGSVDRSQEYHYMPDNKANVYQHIGPSTGNWKDMALSFCPAFSSKSWMSLLDTGPDDTLASITIPGTHDTGTYGGGGLLQRSNQCQTLSIQDQLNAGIRWFDLRLGIVGEELEVHHSSYPQNVFLGKDILPAIKTFLAQQGTETVILCVNQEGGSSASPQGHGFNGLLHKFMMAGVTQNKLYDRPEMPKLADMKGCVVLMRRDAGANFGIQAQGWPPDKKDTFFSPAGNPKIKFSIQDAYAYGTDYLTAKWRNVKDQLAVAAGRSDGEAWYINFTSASRAPLTDPIDIAIDQTNLQGVNYQFHAYLCTQASPMHFGTIPMDFPESPEGLVKLLISMNKLKGI